MNTKQIGDIAEQAAVLHALKRGWGVLKPIGDRLPYDLVFDVDGTLIKIQVKCAWFDTITNNYLVDNRRTKTNRRQMVREAYDSSDFDFALIYLSEIDLFYIMPVEVFISYRSGISIVEADRRQRKPQSAVYRNAWELILHRAACEVTCACLPVKFGEAAGGVIPSQASELNHSAEEGVET